MNVSSIQPGADVQAASPAQSPDQVRLAFQTTLLKKTLDMQKQQAEQMLSAFEGKGQVVDLRV
ncbi:MAG TPA: putative motility protein [Fimbriimonas sp.]|nr:putative motility protein [Fimbriimonas sp.]